MSDNTIQKTDVRSGAGDVMEKIISLCKRRGFIYQGSEIYGGLAGTWDYGPLGVALKKNIENLWWKRFVTDREDMYGVDAAILMNPKVWESSGHVDTFTDPLVEDLKTNKRYRADHLIEAAGFKMIYEGNIANTPEYMADAMNKTIKENKILSPDKNPLGEVRTFNMMLKTHIGPVADDESISYLRPETAAGMFVNFKNIQDTFHPKLPFGMAQIGKAFRNEIAPRDFIFRVRELEQMEIEYFVSPKEWEGAFESFRKEMWCFITEDIGLSKDSVHELEVADGDRAHYSKRTIDFEFDFPFGRKELYGLAYRTDFDLKSHGAGSSVDLSYFDEETKERFIPHCIEPSLGVGRSILAVLTNAYAEDELGGEMRSFLRLSPKVAPFLVAVSPLLKNKPRLVEKSREIYKELKRRFGRAIFDDNGNIGKRYRRQDEIGTPFCVVVDFDTIGGGDGGEDKTDVNKDLLNTVTVRHRDTGEQERVDIANLTKYLEEKLV